MSVLGWLLLAALGALVSAEVIEWCGPAQRALLRVAAAKLPDRHRERYLEEWMAELRTRPGGPLTKFGFVMWLVIGGAGRLARELPDEVQYSPALGSLGHRPTFRLFISPDGEQIVMMRDDAFGKTDWVPAPADLLVKWSVGQPPESDD